MKLNNQMIKDKLQKDILSFNIGFCVYVIFCVFLYFNIKFKLHFDMLLGFGLLFLNFVYCFLYLPFRSIKVNLSRFSKDELLLQKHLSDLQAVFAGYISLCPIGLIAAGGKMNNINWILFYIALVFCLYFNIKLDNIKEFIKNYE